MPGSYIDPDTKIMTKVRRTDGKLLALVMSDEFKEPNRGFGPGEDEIFEALDKPDDSNESIVFYNSTREYITTKDDCLVITTRAKKTSWYEWQGAPEPRTKNYTSAMVQSWNKFCFTGGVLEFSIELPGDLNSGGLWPAVWLMGNLARATFGGSTLYMWPWSYDKCGDIDHLSDKQEIDACNPNPGFGLNAFQGRGAPEIDIFEVMPGHSMPGQAEPVKAFMSSSLQISPGISKEKRPINGHRLNSSATWYDGLHMSNKSDYNFGFWGQECGPEYDSTPERIHKYMEDAISANTYLQETHFTSQHVYALEWQPGPNGYLHWYLDNQHIFGIEGSALQKLTGAMIPVEPMYFILNTAISHRWGMPEPCPAETCGACWRCYDCLNPDCQCSLPEGMRGCKNLPAEMKIDYIRLYQDMTDGCHSLGCSTKSFPTYDFILAHKERYGNWKPMSPSAVISYSILLYSLLVMAMSSLVYIIFGWCRKTPKDSRGIDRSQYSPIV